MSFSEGNLTTASLATSCLGALRPKMLPRSECNGFSTLYKDMKRFAWIQLLDLSEIMSEYFWMGGCVWPAWPIIITCNKWWNPRSYMYAQSHHLKGAGLASDSGSPSMSISVLTSISEQNERVSLDDDCPDYDAVVNKRQDSFSHGNLSIYVFWFFSKQLQCTLPKLPWRL